MFTRLRTINQSFLDWGIVMEYCLPMEIGRRIDVILLNSQHVFVFEIKNTKQPHSSDIDQTKAYTRDIRDYHKASVKKTVQGILGILRAETLDTHDPTFKPKPIYDPKGWITVCSPTPLGMYLENYTDPGITDEQLQAWIKSPYEPLPGLIDAAKAIFKNNALPQLKNVENAGIPKTLEYLHLIVQHARKNGGYHLILIGGVPGSGKTLVGLQFVHEIVSTSEFALYLSGNGPLVKCLQKYIEKSGKTLIRDIAAFIKDYYVVQRPLASTHVLTFDEAQRAWDAPKVFRYFAGKAKSFARTGLKPTMVKKSEPEILTQIVSHMSQWGVLIGLIGDGQVIHDGEEGGIESWAEALQTSNIQWNIHVPDRFQSVFGQCSQCITHVESVLNLTQTLRSHSAEYLADYVNHLIAGRITEALAIVLKIKEAGFFLYLTEDLLLAKEYLRKVYTDQSDKTYGLIASSTATNLIQYGINVKKHRDPTCECTMFRGANDVPYYYYHYNTSKRTDLYCTAFRKVVREYDCQGLELDSVILAWGSDLRWDPTRHQWQNFARRLRTKDPAAICRNAYRVLLTRARDGLIIFCPGSDLNSTRDLLLQVGFERLESLNKM